MKIILCLLAPFAQILAQTLVFVGSYTDAKPDSGIYVFQLDDKTGKLSLKATGHGLVNPSYLSISADGRFLYACTETKMPQNGNISAFEIDRFSGEIALLNKVDVGGENPVYIDLSTNGKWMIASTYTGGTVGIFALKPDGKVEKIKQNLVFSGSGTNQTRQEKPHIHSVVFSPDNQQIMASDLGTDQIRILSFNDETGQVTEKENLKTAIGGGPRHFCFGAKAAYGIEEMGGQINVFRTKNGSLKLQQRISSYSKTYPEYSGADIHLSPEGKFLYSSNRLTENTLGIFKVQKRSGKLKLVGHENTQGEHSRNFAISPNGQWLIVANQHSNNIVVFERNLHSGKLTYKYSKAGIAKTTVVKIYAQ